MTAGSVASSLRGFTTGNAQVDGYIMESATRHGLDPLLIYSVMHQESSFKQRAISHKGARGLMQLMPATARRYGVTKIHDPEQNIQGGVRYLAFLFELFGDIPRTLAAYNAGEGAVMKYGGIPPYQETSTYVVRAMTVYYGRPYASGAYSIAGRRAGPKLKGGFGKAAAPVAAAVLPGVKYLGSH